MASYSRQLLGGSTNGKPIQIAANSSPGTTIHTSLTGTAGFDEIYAWFTNTDTIAHQVTIEYGTTGVAAHLVDTYTIPANSAPIPLITGQVLQNGLTVAVFADAANKINVTGFVNRIQ